MHTLLAYFIGVTAVMLGSILLVGAIILLLGRDNSGNQNSGNHRH
jgi:hypothetical protein